MPPWPVTSDDVCMYMHVHVSVWESSRHLQGTATPSTTPISSPAADILSCRHHHHHHHPSLPTSLPPLLPSPGALVWERKLLLIKSFQRMGWKGRWNWAAQAVLFLLRMGAGLSRSLRRSRTRRGSPVRWPLLPRGQSKWFASLRLQRGAITLK